MSFLNDLRRRFAALGGDDPAIVPVEPLTRAPGRAPNPDRDGAGPALAMEASESAWRSWISLSGLFAWETDAYGRFIRIGADAFGWRADDLIGQHALELAPEPERPAARMVFGAQQAVQGVEFWLRRRDGMLAAVSAAALAGAFAAAAVPDAFACAAGAENSAAGAITPRAIVGAGSPVLPSITCQPGTRSDFLTA